MTDRPQVVDSSRERKQSWEVRQGDALERLRELPGESVRTCVTSPPYWGLRDYGTAEWEGGDLECDHLAPPGGGTDASTLGPKGDGLGQAGVEQVTVQRRQQYRDLCGKCGATRTDSQLGLEPTPDEYVANLVAVFREVRRVLRQDGTLWLNLGDSYARMQEGNVPQTKNVSVAFPLHSKAGSSDGAVGRGERPGGQTRATGLKPKDLVGIPWRVAFALQADGWWLRSDIIWAKPNPMPESVTDRPTRSHEYLFLLAKSKTYFYDAAAIREPAQDRESVSVDTGSYAQASGRMDGGIQHGFAGFGADAAGRNKRSVWPVATQPYTEAHFATFPPKLIEPCVLAGSTPDGVVLDPFCGAGTTGVVALRRERSFIGIELNPDYCEMARERIRNDGPLFNVASEAA